VRNARHKYHYLFDATAGAIFEVAEVRRFARSSSILFVIMKTREGEWIDMHLVEVRKATHTIVERGAGNVPILLSTIKADSMIHETVWVLPDP
jgi:hypothetical protein